MQFNFINKKLVHAIIEDENFKFCIGWHFIGNKKMDENDTTVNLEKKCVFYSNNNPVGILSCIEDESYDHVIIKYKDIMFALDTLAEMKGQSKKEK